MALTRLSLRTAVRNELQDTGATPFVTDAVIHNGLQGAAEIYSRYWPIETSNATVSVASQSTIVLPAAPYAAMGQSNLDVLGVTIDGVTIAPVPTFAVLHEPAWPGQYSQTRVNPYPVPGAVATGWQGWYYTGGTISLRYTLDAGHAIVVAYTLSHFLPTDDVTALTIPDADQDLLVLSACDRAVRAMRVDAIRRGAPGTRLLQEDDIGYHTRFAEALMRRRNVVRVRTMTQLQ